MFLQVQTLVLKVSCIVASKGISRCELLMNIIVDSNGFPLHVAVIQNWKLLQWSVYKPGKWSMTSRQHPQSRIQCRNDMGTLTPMKRAPPDPTWLVKQSSQRSHFANVLHPSAICGRLCMCDTACYYTW